MCRIIDFMEGIAALALVLVAICFIMTVEGIITVQLKVLHVNFMAL